MVSSRGGGLGGAAKLWMYNVNGGNGLPLTTEPALPASEATEGVPQGLAVMLVEDDADVRRVIRLQLVSLGYPVIEADHATEALGLLTAAAVDGDVVQELCSSSLV